MKKRVFINAFYNLIVILCTIGVFWAYENKSPLIVIFFVTVFAAILYYKLKLLKEIRQEFKEVPGTAATKQKKNKTN